MNDTVAIYCWLGVHFYLPIGYHPSYKYLYLCNHFLCHYFLKCVDSVVVLLTVMFPIDMWASLC